MKEILIKDLFSRRIANSLSKNSECYNGRIVDEPILTLNQLKDYIKKNGLIFNKKLPGFGKKCEKEVRDLFCIDIDKYSKKYWYKLCPECGKKINKSDA